MNEASSFDNGQSIWLLLKPYLQTQDNKIIINLLSNFSNSVKQDLKVSKTKMLSFFSYLRKSIRYQFYPSPIKSWGKEFLS